MSKRSALYRGAWRVGESIPIEDAVDEFLEIRKSESKSGAHLKDLRLRLKAFVLTRPAKQLVAAVTTSDVDTWLTGLPVAAQTRTNYRTVLNNFFKFAVSRGYAPTNPVSAAVKFRVLAKAPGILTPAQLRALLNACVNEIRAAVAMELAVSTQGGNQRLNWQHVKVDRKFIEVVAANSKTAQRRLGDDLGKSRFAPLARAEGPVCPPFNLYRHPAAALKNARSRAGRITRSGILREPSFGEVQTQEDRSAAWFAGLDALRAYRAGHGGRSSRILEHLAVDVL